MVKHTPGPWSAGNEVLRGELRPVLIPGRRGDIHIAHCLETMQDGEREANARLIAAAPELLEACKTAADLLMCDNDNDDPCTEYGPGEKYGDDCNPCAQRRILWAAVAKAEGK
jgi:hypothetical protein